MQKCEIHYYFVFMGNLSCLLDGRINNDLFWLLQLVTRQYFSVDCRGFVKMHWEYVYLLLSLFPFAFPENDVFLWSRLKLKPW